MVCFFFTKKSLIENTITKHNKQRLLSIRRADVKKILQEKMLGTRWNDCITPDRDMVTNKVKLYPKKKKSFIITFRLILERRHLTITTIECF